MPPKVIDVDIGQAGDMLFGEAQRADDVAAERKLGQTELTKMTNPTEKAEPPPGEDPTSADATGKVGELLTEAKTQLGVNYVYGGSTWGSALDCSGFVQQAYKRIGIDLPRVTYDQVNAGTAVNGLDQARPGDLIFTTGDIGMRKNGHVGIYLGNNQYIVAPRTGQKVQIQSLAGRSIDNIRRII